MRRGDREAAPEKRPRKIQWSKLMALLVVLLGFAIVQECFVLMYLCIRVGYTSTAAWLTAAVGLAEAVIAAGVTGYFGVCKVDHKQGGVTYAAAEASGFIESPPI